MPTTNTNPPSSSSSSSALPPPPPPTSAAQATAPAEGLDLDIEDVLYSANSFWAVLKPVSLTMFLAALVCVNVDFGSDDQGVSVYTIDDGDADGTGGDSNSVKLGKSVINALTIVGVICAATFLVVLLYKFRCMKCLFGYMAFSCTMLLGLMGGLLWLTAMVKWDLPCDYLTYVVVLYNFAFVGVVAIFYQKGIPTWVTQGYLVMISVIMAWQLSRFEEWTGWSLLVVLAFYDLCAVLTPCGPLRYLVGLMQEYNEPMPGLLYEAELPAHAQHHRRQRGGAAGGATGNSAASSQSQSQPQQGEEGAAVMAIPGGGGGGGGMSRNSNNIDDNILSHSPPSPLDPLLDGTQGSPGGTHLTTPVMVIATEAPVHHLQHRPDGSVRLLEEGEIAAAEAGVGVGGGEMLVVAGDTAASVAGEDDSTRGVGGGGAGAARTRAPSHHPEHEERSIKLGLGDFVFYSVLVSKAAIYGFATCAACFLVIIAGLGATLVLLSVFRKALPALPISIGLGVLFYLLTRVIIIPYIDALVGAPFYV